MRPEAYHFASATARSFHRFRESPLETRVYDPALRMMLLKYKMTGFLLVAATSAPPRPSSPLTVMEATTLSRASPTVSPYYSERSSYSQKSNNIASCYCYIDYNSRNSLIGTTPNKTKRSRLFFSVMASSFNTSSGDRKRNNKNDNTAAATAKAKSQAMELQRIFEDDSQSRPKPLSVTDVSNFVVHGSSLRVAYQGVPGAYSESAAEKAYPNCEAVPCEQFDTAFDAVERWLVDRAVLPIENSLGGSIHRNYDLLLRHSLHIVGEVRLSVRHCLLANHDVRLEDLKRVLSHPQALAQCENTLTKLGVVREAVDDTAGAAQYVALHNLQDAGAVASSGAAKIYGLNILAHDIQDYSDNVTRFLMLAREPIIPGTDRPFKTSIVFSLEQGPGVLFKALAVFAMRNINLTKIESRPRRRQPFNDTSSGSQQKCFDYLFYVDFEASMADPNSQNALRHLEVDSHRVLGLPCFLVRCRRKQSVPF